jgi:S1-C subfamily serine protease
MEAGIQRRDVILRWGETDINDPLHLSHAVLLSKPGTTETVEIFRAGEYLKIDVTVGVRPTDF